MTPQPEKKAVIQVQNLIAGYGDHVVLDDVSFEVYKGEILVILGGSGCGKSTLLRHMIGLENPMSGRVLIDGVDITACDDDTFRDALKKIGVLFQSAALFGSMTLAENVALPVAEYTDLSKGAVRTLVHMKLCLVDLEGYDHHLPSELSGGMKKRAGLARALALNPTILFLDEPSAGLDPITSVEIDALITRINQTIGTTMVIITHELESVFGVAQRIIMLDKNKKGIIAEGNPVYLKDHSDIPAVRQFFNRQPGDRPGGGNR